MSFPPSMTTWVRAPMQFAGNNTATYQGFSFYGNSAYDPTGSNSAVKASGFTEMSDLYSTYRVDEIVVDAFLNMTSENGMLLLTPLLTSAEPTTTLENLSMPYAKVAPATAAGVPAKLSLRIKPWVALGISESRYKNDDAYSADVAADPAKLIRVYVRVAGSGGTNILNTDSCYAVIKQKVVFFDRKKLVQ